MWIIIHIYFLDLFNLVFLLSRRRCQSCVASNGQPKADRHTGARKSATCQAAGWNGPP